MNGFELHGVTAISNSSCRDFAADPAAFLIGKVMGIRSPGGPPMHRGNAVEAGIAAGLKDADLPLEKCQEIALADFDRRSALSSDPRVDEERKGIPGMVSMGLAELRPYGAPSHVQHKIEWRHPDIAIPFIGYVDFYWENHGIILDLKTTLRLASEVSRSHASQVALYCGAISDNLEGRVSYVTPKKSATYLVENMREHREALVITARAIERFLSLSDTVEGLSKYIVPNYENYFWNDKRCRQAAFELWGF